MVLVMALAMFHAGRAGRRAGCADGRIAQAAAGRTAAGADARARLGQCECGAREQRSRSGRNLQNFHWWSPLCFFKRQNYAWNKERNDETFLRAMTRR